MARCPSLARCVSGVMVLLTARTGCGRQLCSSTHVGQWQCVAALLLLEGAGGAVRQHCAPLWLAGSTVLLFGWLRLLEQLVCSRSQGLELQLCLQYSVGLCPPVLRPGSCCTGFCSLSKPLTRGVRAAGAHGAGAPGPAHAAQLVPRQLHRARGQPANRCAAGESHELASPPASLPAWLARCRFLGTTAGSLVDWCC